MSYRTLDGSMINELVRPEREGSRNLSLAEATIAPGETTHRHRHAQSEEIYYILSGEGIVEVAAHKTVARAGDAVLIPPGAEHCATNTGPEPLRILCACSPPYEHDDTELTEDATV
ncbi:MAG: cupin domain-containing protein [Bacteroidota bacterium]